MTDFMRLVESNVLPCSRCDRCGPCPCILDPVHARRVYRDLTARHREAMARAVRSGWAATRQATTERRAA